MDELAREYYDTHDRQIPEEILRRAFGLEQMMEESPLFEVVTKLEAADRQLRVAIRLFFERKDLIAIHTLTAAARGILGALARPRGIVGIDATIERLPPEYRKMLHDAFSKAQNFFKHADRDASGKLKLTYEQTQFLLIEAAIICRALSSNPSPEVAVMATWAAMKFPEWFEKNQPQAALFFKLAKRTNINPDDFDFMLTMIDKLSPKAK